MNPSVESALISGAATVLSVGATALVAIVGFRLSRSATERTVAAARDTNQATIDAAHADVRRTLDATRDGQIADRYTKAIEQLGSTTIDVTIGGIYALERIARDSPRDHPTVMEVLAACIREHSNEQWPKPDATTPQRSTRPDIQAALTVLGRRDTERDTRPIDLSGANLTRANLAAANLANANLTGANLTGANLADANLGLATLVGANLTDADLSATGLGGAGLMEADLSGANLSDTYLNSANLFQANLNGAYLAETSLVGAILTNADLAAADLIGCVF